ncbi:MAG: hypothetical protein N0C81_02495 [Candidatus Thiodiazotropha lotti]|uniref:Uncharacterized protein n=1 Tax=Candidatus Thiodiazotropha lotti TaxID=2792787 RepID=A0A9E4K5E2_9GAMM|nr:hypothetical protein [Candidatus Thiodiazotropha lotti]ODC01663.1 hypothetical protein A3197_04155 [Candidatus Thiodiazotropha endoloripes]MCG7921236.1 hypothetical protein [Candidatus Thiodiazotropha lotti]MCG7939867.1 hypothetical protein [Candidatus Thiodiazotropha lotti]MCG7987709.1 hypothetical protein [Candidatus Thiodiazotropha lotti]
MKGTLRQLCCTVQRNCHISDARHGTDYGLCTYLLKMREYYRWENGLDYETSLANESVGDWLTAREALWESLVDDNFDSLPIDGQVYDPFDVEAINQSLEPLGLVYSAGYGAKNKPLFFLGHLERREEPEGISVWVAGRELARDLSAPAAMNQGGRIYIRRESFRRLLWEKFENWRWQQADNALGRAFSHYDFENQLQSSLDLMVEKELAAVLLHEKGEYQAGRILGDQWNEMVLELGHSAAELMVRAVRDHWADCQVTLPQLLEDEDEASLHFYIGGLTGMRKSLFPALISAYEGWYQDRDWQRFYQLVSDGQAHWSGLATRLLDCYRSRPVDTRSAVKQMVEESIF